MGEHEEPFHTALGRRITAATPDILREFETALRSAGSPLLKDESSRAQILAQARGIVEETAQRLSGQTSGEIRAIGVTLAPPAVHPHESLRAANLLFATVVAHLAGVVTIQQLTAVALTAHDVVADAMRVAAEAYMGFLLKRVHQAQVEERKRVSRELHDRIGSGISIAQRDLELFEIYRVTEPDRALARVVAARRLLVQSIESVRRAISDLRLVDPVDSLEKTIKQFLERTAAGHLAYDVQVNGDEAWAPGETVEEAFLITREALLNTIRHAGATAVAVRIDISPSVLWASIADDGRGFDPNAPGTGTGLLSMRERAMLLGGTLLLRTVPGQGTWVELRIPLGRGAS